MSDELNFWSGMNLGRRRINKMYKAFDKSLDGGFFEEEAIIAYFKAASEWMSNISGNGLMGLNYAQLSYIHGEATKMLNVALAVRTHPDASPQLQMLANTLMRQAFDLLRAVEETDVWRAAMDKAEAKAEELEKELRGGGGILGDVPQVDDFFKI